MSLLTAPMVGCGGDDSTSPSNDGGAGGEAGAAGAGGAVAPPAECGNGVRETGEACDDGDTTNEGACLADCSGSTSCGDGKVQSSEDCDDGNDINTDECTNKCVAAANGDGIIQPSLNEQCDDGNRVNTDDCTNDGQIAICGDGIVQVGVEACDAGKATEKCTADCALPTCGDGIVQTGEDCDDQNKSNTDSCLNTCLDASCGDGFIQAGVETCDSGNANSDTAECLTSCERASCGDGHVQAGVEACDESGATAACTVDCKPTSCGDGIQQDNEECDEGDANADNASASCTTSCTLPICGDGIQQGAEACDDGNGVTTDGCIECVVATCGDGIIWTNNETCDDGKANGTSDSECSATCGPVSCGDGVVQAGEQCDEGTSNSNTGACRTNCVAAACGDGAIQAGVEQCDDGALNGDTGACLSDCVAAICGDGKVQSGVEACDGGGEATADCTAECTSTDCGDGVIQTGEQCDNGADNANTADATCTTACLEPACGDKIVQTGEDCDDGNLTDNDSCSNACKSPICGDKIVQAGEGCDDGNTVETDGCSNTCQLTTCGNSIVETGEQCDDGNASNTDLCLTTCQLPTCGDGFVQLGLDYNGDGDTGDTIASVTEASVHKDLNGDGDMLDTLTNVAESTLGEECDAKATGTSVVNGCTPDCQLNACGDGFRQTATYDNDADGKVTTQTTAIWELVEDCDDGDRVDTNGCTNRCTVSTCGDGVLQAGETCDLGECYDSNGDGRITSLDVTHEDGSAGQVPGADCNMNVGNTACTEACKAPGCGDSYLQTGALVPLDETCDDGNLIATDACTDKCAIATCGDKVVRAGVEACDGGAGCEADCALSTCGDTKKGTDEVCDNSVTTPAADVSAAGACTNACFANVCGDGFRGAGEECDYRASSAIGVPSVSGTAQGNIAAVAGAHDAINNNAAIVCTDTCKVNYCGDGIVGGSEVCDDGNRVDTDACHNDCTMSKCGDGKVDAGEECDDGADNDNGGGCTEACTLPKCGDGYIQSYTTAAGLKVTEGCDDGNTAAANPTTNDLCSATCVPATCGAVAGPTDGYYRYRDNNAGSLTAITVVNECNVDTANNKIGCPTAGTPASCRACNPATDDFDDDPTNGIQINYGTVATPALRSYFLVAEGCDDGNADNTDSCRNDCQDAVCGDGVEGPGEACDDGNNVEADNCTTVCEVAGCDDGIINLRQVAVDLNADGDKLDVGERVGDMEECDLGSVNAANNWCSDNCAKQCSTAVANAQTALDTAEYFTWNDPAARANCYVSMNDADGVGDNNGADGAEVDITCPGSSHLISVDSAAEFTVLQNILKTGTVASTAGWITCPATTAAYSAWDTAAGEPTDPTGSPTFAGLYSWGTGLCYTYKFAENDWRWYSTPAVTFASTDNRTYVCEVDAWANTCGDGVLKAGFEVCDEGTDNRAGSYGTLGDCASDCVLVTHYCGDGTKDTSDGEACDNGAANVNGGAAGTCSLTCTLND